MLDFLADIAWLTWVCRCHGWIYEKSYRYWLLVRSYRRWLPGDL